MGIVRVAIGQIMFDHEIRKIQTKVHVNTLMDCILDSGEACQPLTQCPSPKRLPFHDISTT